MTKKAALYARVSSQGKNKSETIESQIEAIKKYAESENYHIPDHLIFIDNNISGYILQRPALDDLRDMIRMESIDVILCYSPDRLSRYLPHFYILREEFRKNGVKPCFLNDGPKDQQETAQGRLLVNVQSVIAEYERELIIDRTRRGRIFKAKKGDPSALPSFPYGYKRVKHGNKTTVELIEEEVVVVKEIFRLYVFEKMSLAGITRHLVSKGIKTPKGNERWDESTVRDILKNTGYIGTSYYGKTQRSEGIPNRIRHHQSGKIIKPKYARTRLPQDKWIPINIPSIISESDFELAQEQINKNKIFASRNTKIPTLLQGLIICGECGYPFYSRYRKLKKGIKGIYYCKSHHGGKHLNKCSNINVNQEELDALVFEEVMKLVKDPQIIQQELSRRAKESDNDDIARNEINLKKELLKTSQERDRLLDAYQSGLLDLDGLSKRQKALDLRKTTLDNELGSIQSLRIQQELGINLQNALKSIMEGIEETSQELSFDNKQKLIRLLVEKIVIKPNEVKIQHCISPKIFFQNENVQLSGGGNSSPFGT